MINLSFPGTPIDRTPQLTKITLAVDWAVPPLLEVESWGLDLLMGVLQYKINLGHTVGQNNHVNIRTLKVSNSIKKSSKHITPLNDVVLRPHFAEFSSLGYTQ